MQRQIMLVKETGTSKGREKQQ